MSIEYRTEKAVTEKTYYYAICNPRILCDHIVGTVGGELIRMSQLTDPHTWNDIIAINSLREQKELRNHSCPLCGSRIDWDKIEKTL